MKKHLCANKLISLLLTTVLMLNLIAPAVSAANASATRSGSGSRETDFITSQTDIDELLKSDYFNSDSAKSGGSGSTGNVVGYNENVYSLYQPGWGFDKAVVYRTGVRDIGWGMPVTLKADGNPLSVAAATSVPSYVTSAYTSHGSTEYINVSTGAQMIAADASFDSGADVPQFKVSHDRTNGAKYLFDGLIPGNGNNVWVNKKSAGQNVNDTDWVEIVYPNEITLDAIRFQAYSDNTAPVEPPHSVSVQVWDETANSWKDATNAVAGDSFVFGSNLITFDTLTGSRFRLNFGSSAPTNQKWFIIEEIEMLSRKTVAAVEITGYKYVAVDDMLAVILEAKNNGTVPVAFEATASAAFASGGDQPVAAVDGKTLVAEAAGYQMRIAGDEGFAPVGTNLISVKTAAPGETVTFRLALAYGEALSDTDAALDAFFADEAPLKTQKDSFNQWFLDSIPYADLPDETLKQIYYFRWYTYRNHIRMTTDDYYVISEFLKNVSHSGAHNAISCAAGHHVDEGRWIKNDVYLDDYLSHWMDHDGVLKTYSNWIADAYYGRYLVNQDDFVLDYLDAFKNNYSSDWGRHYVDEMGLYYQHDGSDGMERSLSEGYGYRPTINSYMYANAMAIAEMCSLAGDEAGAEEYTRKAEAIKANMESVLWDEDMTFYKVLMYDRTSGEAADALNPWREQLGYIPWMFNIPVDDEAHGNAWNALMDEAVLAAPYGPRTGEKQYAAEIPESDFTRNWCNWNGPSWPYSTSQTLVAMANLLNNYENQTAVDKDDYYAVLKTYANSHYKTFGGVKYPWIAENLDPDSGRWINDDANSVNYNHSQFNNLIITGLLGIRPDGSDVLTVNPLIPDEWDYFCLENVAYHDHLITLLYDADGTRYGQGAGFKVYVDGECVASEDEVRTMKITLDEVVRSESYEKLEQLYNTHRRRNADDYTEESWEPFKQALRNAQTVLADESSDEEELQSAYDALYESVRYLEMNPSGGKLYEAEKAAINRCTASSNPNSSGGQYVGAMDYADSSVTFTVEVPAAGTYDITVMGATGAAKGSHRVYANGDASNYQVVQYENLGWRVFKAYALTLELKEGINTVTFIYNPEGVAAQIDCISVHIPPVDKSELGELYDKCRALSGTDYTTESWEVLVQAMEAAEAVVYNPENVDVATAIELLQKAWEGLVPVVNEVMQAIDAIGQVTLEKKNLIDAARAAYDALTEDQKSRISNYQTLLDAEMAYSVLVSDENAAQAAAAREAAETAQLAAQSAAAKAEAAQAAAEAAMARAEAAQAAAEEAEKNADADAASAEAARTAAENASAAAEAAQTKAEAAQEAAAVAQSKAEASRAAAEAAAQAAEKSNAAAAEEAARAAQTAAASAKSAADSAASAANAAQAAGESATSAAAAAEAAKDAQAAKSAAEAAQDKAEAAQMAAEEAEKNAGADADAAAAAKTAADTARTLAEAAQAKAEAAQAAAQEAMAAAEESAEAAAKSDIKAAAEAAKAAVLASDTAKSAVKAAKAAEESAGYAADAAASAQNAQAAQKAAEEAKAAAEAAKVAAEAEKAAAENAKDNAEAAQSAAEAAQAAAEAAKAAAETERTAAEAAKQAAADAQLLAEAAQAAAREDQLIAQAAKEAVEAAQRAVEEAKAAAQAEKLEAEAERKAAEEARIAAEAAQAAAGETALNGAKVQAVLNLDSYAEKLCSTQYLEQIVAAAREDIEAAETAAEVQEILAQAKADMDGIAELCPSAGFEDVTGGAWYHDYVDYMVEKGFMNGMSDTLFGVDSSLTRGQFVTVLYRIAGAPALEDPENPFADVEAGKWFTDAVVWAAGEGIVKGVSETTFEPNAPISRQQIVTILYRYSGEMPVEEDYLAGYSDAAEVFAYAQDPMNWAIANGVINGMTPTTLAPAATATRGQICAIMMRYLEQ